MKNATNPKIDFVIAYVNNNDIVWRNTYIDFCRTHNLNERIVDLLGRRFNGITFVYNQIKLVNKNMPWVNKIYLLLSNKEQIDESKLPKNVEIVLHNQFIPKRFLPTFNSTTIEMFLWNIPNVSEYFIYANDDMLPTGKLEPQEFFENGKIKIEWREDLFDERQSMYAYQCRNNCCSMCEKFNIKYENILLRPVHSFTPMIKTHCKESYDLLKDLIEPHIRAFRTIKQYNQYIYPLYEYYKYGTLNSDIDFFYTELKEDFELNHQICCINGEKNKEFVAKFEREIEELCK